MVTFYIHNQRIVCDPRPRFSKVHRSTVHTHPPNHNRVFVYQIFVVVSINTISPENRKAPIRVMIPDDQCFAASHFYKISKSDGMNGCPDGAKHVGENGWHQRYELLNYLTPFAIQIICEIENGRDLPLFTQRGHGNFNSSDCGL